MVLTPHTHMYMLSVIYCDHMTGASEAHPMLAQVDLHNTKNIIPLLALTDLGGFDGLSCASVQHVQWTQIKELGLLR